MTKSFVAATVLALRDERQLGLDDLVSDYVPAVGSWRLPTSDSAPLRVRDLLSMSAGLPTDDPWADRLLDISQSDVVQRIGQGVTFSTAPGSTFEYSNLGYVLLGQVILAADGQSAQRAIRERFLDPLGMTSTGWDIPTGDAMVGHRIDDEVVTAEDPPLADGAWAPMAGLWSTVEDLARWVAFFLDAYPARDGDAGAPLGRHSRREMQSIHRAEPPQVSRDGALSAAGYGFGLRVIARPGRPDVVTHAGGLPGYGSFMAWCPARDVGVVAMGNLTYSRLGQVSVDVLDTLATTRLPPAPSAPLERSRDALLALLTSDARDAREASAFTPDAFADNVLPDRAASRRLADLRTAVSSIGGVSTVGELHARSATDGVFTVSGPDGVITIDLLLTPEPRPRIQKYSLRPAADVSSAHHSTEEV